MADKTDYYFWYYLKNNPKCLQLNALQKSLLNDTETSRPFDWLVFILLLIPITRYITKFRRKSVSWCNQKLSAIFVWFQTLFGGVSFVPKRWNQTVVFLRQNVYSFSHWLTLRNVSFKETQGWTTVLTKCTASVQHKVSDFTCQIEQPHNLYLSYRPRFEQIYWKYTCPTCPFTGLWLLGSGLYWTSTALKSIYIYPRMQCTHFQQKYLRCCLSDRCKT